MPARSERLATGLPARAPSLLRLGVQDASGALAERLVRHGDVVTVGPRERDVAPAERVAELFRWGPEGPELVVPAGAKARWSRGEGVQELVPGDRLVVDAAVRGRVEIGGVRVLFQVVPAPVAAPLPDLRPRLLDTEDPLFLGLLGVLSVAAGLFWAWVLTQPAPQDVALTDISEIGSIVKDLPRIPLADPEAPVLDDTPSDRAPEQRHAPRATPRTDRNVAPEDRPSAALIQVIGSFGLKPGQTAFTHIFGDGPAVEPGILDRIHADHAVTEGDVVRGSAVHEGEHQVRVEGTKDGDSDVATNAVHVRAVVKESRPDVTGDAGDESSRIATAVKQQQAGIETCVEQALKGNPSMSGRVEARWVVRTGRVFDVEVIGNTTQDADLGACVQRAVRRFRFPEDLTAEVGGFPWVVSGE